MSVVHQRILYRCPIDFCPVGRTTASSVCCAACYPQYIHTAYLHQPEATVSHPSEHHPVQHAQLRVHALFQRQECLRRGQVECTIVTVDRAVFSQAFSECKGCWPGAQIRNREPELGHLVRACDEVAFKTIESVLCHRSLARIQGVSSRINSPRTLRKTPKVVSDIDHKTRLELPTSNFLFEDLRPFSLNESPKACHKRRFRRSKLIGR